MNSSTTKAGLATHLPPTDWLSHQDGRRLAFTAYPARRPWLHLLISHGYGEHRRWWHHVAEGFQAQGISTYTFDHFHHGTSEGKPGDIRSYEELIDGLKLALGAGVLPNVSGQQKIAILGHSNGGLGVLRAIEELPKERLIGIILSNPLLAMRKRLTRFGIPLAKFLRFIHSGLMVHTPSFPPLLTSDRTLWPHYLRDPLRLQKGSVSYVVEMHQESKIAFESASCGGLPLLLLWSGRDGVVNGHAAIDWFERLKESRKKVVKYPRMRHELFQEPVWPEVVETAAEWLRTVAKETKSNAPVKKAPGGKPAIKKAAPKIKKETTKQAATTNKTSGKTKVEETTEKPKRKSTTKQATTKGARKPAGSKTSKPKP